MVKRTPTSANFRELLLRLAQAVGANTTDYFIDYPTDPMWGMWSSVLSGDRRVSMEAKKKVGESFWGERFEVLVSMLDYETTRRLFRTEVVPHIKVRHALVELVRPIMDEFSLEYACKVLVSDVDTVNSRDW